MAKKLIGYIKKLILSDSKESSKRFIMLYTMILVSYVVIAFTTPLNAEMILGILCGFVLTLAGVATWRNSKDGINE